MQVKLYKKKNPISPEWGWCFKRGAYNEELLKQLNSGEVVEVEFIPVQARWHVLEVQESKQKGAE